MATEAGWSDGRSTFAIHATAIVISGRALLIRGPSRAGKSRLAFALIAASTLRRPICLIGDDRVVLTSIPGRLTARPHPRIAGFLERRGLGIVAMPFASAAPVAAVIDLEPVQPAVCSTFCTVGGENFPLLTIVTTDEAEAQRDRVLCWFASVCAPEDARHADHTAQLKRLP